MAKKIQDNPTSGFPQENRPRRGTFLPARRWLSYLIGTLLAVQPVVPAYAADVNVAAGNTRIDQAGNGVPIVDIATPNQAGVSHNKFNDFNVGKEGMILNNSTDRLTQTQLGGLIQNNANLQAGKEAKGIINEVVGANRSQLQGYIEVGGKAASVMVANPYGITCDGCGFINTPNATLTTGKPIIGADGKVQALEVTRGSITIEGKGLDAGNSDAVTLVSRATEINASLHAKDLTIITGSNRVSKDGTVTPIASEEEKPKIAIDTGALGGMYANRIRLVSSEKGVGVNIGNMNARQGDVSIDANGKLRLGNTLAAGSLKVNAQDLAVSGAQRAEQDITLTSRKDIIVNDAVISSGKNLALQADGRLALNKSQLQAGADAEGNLSAGSRLSVRADRQQWTASTLAADNVAVDAGGSLHQDGNSRASAMTDVSIQGGELALDGRTEAGRDVAITAKRLTLAGQGKVDARRDVHLRLDHDATLRGSVSAERDVILKANRIDNHGKLDAGRNAELSGKQLNNQGRIQAQNRQSVTVSQVANGGTLSAGETLRLSADSLSNSGHLTGQRGVSLHVADLLNIEERGELYSGAEMTVQAGRFLLAGLAQAQGNVTINADKISTAAGSRLLSGADMTLTAGTLLLDGLVSADGRLIINGDRLFSAASARIQAQNALLIDAAHAELQGVFYTLGHLTLRGETLDFRGSSASGDMTVHNDIWYNRGQVQVGGSLNVQAGTLVQQGAILVQNLAQLTLKSLDNQGTINAGTLALSAAETLNNRATGVLSATQSLALNGGRIANQGKITADELWLDAGTLTNGGLLQAGRLLDVNVTRYFNNSARGFLLAGDTLTLRGGELYNAGIWLGRSLTAEAATFNNRGTVLAIDELRTYVAGELRNSGAMLSRQDIEVKAGTLIDSGLIKGNVALEPYTDRVFYRSGTLLNARSTVAAEPALLSTYGSATWSSPLQSSSSRVAALSTTLAINPQSVSDVATARNPLDDLYEMQGQKPAPAPQETGKSFTDADTFIGTAYFLDRINLHPDYDYRFPAESSGDSRYGYASAGGEGYSGAAGADIPQLQSLIERATQQNQAVRLVPGLWLTAESATALAQSFTLSVAAEEALDGVSFPVYFLTPAEAVLQDGRIVGDKSTEM